MSNVHPLLINRELTLHRLGIKDVLPIFDDGRRINLHILLSTYLNPPVIYSHAWAPTPTKRMKYNTYLNTRWMLESNVSIALNISNVIQNMPVIICILTCALVITKYQYGGQYTGNYDCKRILDCAYFCFWLVCWISVVYQM